MQERRRAGLVGRHRPERGLAAAAGSRRGSEQAAQTSAAVPHLLGRARPERAEGGAADPAHERLARWIVDRQPCVGQRPGLAVAVLGALIATGGEDRLPLRGRFLEQGALGLRVAWRHERLALAPRRGHHASPVLGDQRVPRVVVARSRRRGGRIRSLVDQDRRLGGEPDHLLYVERRLALAGTSAGAAIDRDARHRRVRPVAGLIGGDVGRGIGLELVQRHGLALALGAGPVQT